jgi:hypothetical protein
MTSVASVGTAVPSPSVIAPARGTNEWNTVIAGRSRLPVGAVVPKFSFSETNRRTNEAIPVLASKRPLYGERTLNTRTSDPFYLQWRRDELLRIRGSF